MDAKDFRNLEIVIFVYQAICQLSLQKINSRGGVFVRLTKLIPQNTTGVICMKATVKNQNGIKVFEGQHKYLIKKRI